MLALASMGAPGAVWFFEAFVVCAVSFELIRVFNILAIRLVQ